MSKPIEDVLYLEIGDRTPQDEADYPDDDLQILVREGKPQYFHKDGAPY